MLITKTLPINTKKFAQQDQILTITGANWQDYQDFDSEEYPGYLVSYWNGEITIISPGRNHERIAELINRLIIAYCEKFDILDFLLRQTRLEANKQAGKEPDLAYAFNTDKDLPDLVVEVIFSSGNIDNLKASYQSIGISELWIWQNNQITFYWLDRSNYVEIESSKLFDKISAKSFINFVNRGLTDSPSLIKKDFLKTL
ncbi:MAG: Uma2 family endonuclease [Xenococcaceae cyanobacterium MO_167.B27]|nr:Uma2 family endonuclease [Xenococcaceae cyanobacterium MO_167.B27]